MIKTQTIDITHVKTVLDNCPNYDYIINYDYEYGDTLSSKLIDWYRELIFSAASFDDKQLQIIRAIDKSLYLYVKDNRYKRGLSNIVDIEEISFENKNLIKELIKKIIIFTNNYEKRLVLDISSSKWL